MADPAQLPHLLSLMDDEDPIIQRVVLDNLAGFGDQLAHELRMLPKPPDEARIAEIERQVQAHSAPDAHTGPGGAPAEPRMMFKTGDLVRHRRYGYRGVVVSGDLSCQAPDAWYHSNRTKPPRNQPWFHVLVHGTTTITYAAQTSLKADESGQPVRHPLVGHYFGDLVNGRYERNERPWPDRG